MKCNYHNTNIQSEFDSLKVDENAKGLQTENYSCYHPISLSMQVGWVGVVWGGRPVSI